MNHSRWIAVVVAGLALAAPARATAASAPNWTYAWGANNLGQLGRGTFTAWDVQPSAVPAVSALAGQRIVALSLGSDHVLAIRKDGSVWAWGGNNSGQLGDGTFNASATPVAVIESATTPLTNVMAIAAGWQFSLALKNDGTVWAWGRNVNGELGDGTRTGHQFAMPVMDSSGAALSDVRALAAGWGYAAAAKNDKTVWEWGRPLYLQMGAASTADLLVATRLGALSFCIDLGGGAPCPTGGADFIGTPTDICSLAVGKWHAVAADCSGMVVTWGLNDEGQLGQPTSGTDWTCPGTVATPCRSAAGPAFLSNIVAVAAGDDYSLAMDSSGAVFAWGANSYGTLGDGTTSQHTAPAPVTDASGSALTGITAIAGGEFHALARKGDMTVMAWGLAGKGQLGTSSGLQICPTNSQPCATRAVAAAVPGGPEVLDALAAGGFTSAAAGGPVVTVLPGSKSLNFPFQPTLVESAKQKLTLFNRDSAALAVSAIVMGNPRFLETDTCTATPVSPDASCDIDVSFKPFVGGAQAGSMEVKHSRAPGCGRARATSRRHWRSATPPSRRRASSP
jgi:alpha-tubulin suppressor-like RCC1 family protein